jgi:hypothetical protein
MNCRLGRSPVRKSELCAVAMTGNDQAGNWHMAEKEDLFSRRDLISFSLRKIILTKIIK